MGDLTQIESSSPVTITGGDEQHNADVILKGDGARRLLVDSETAISSDLRIIQESGLNQTLDDVNFFDLYNENGTITISGFLIEFSDKKVEVRLEIDGQEIFRIDCEALKDISDWNASPQPQTYVSWNDGLKVFYFTPNFPIKSETNITIQIKSKAGESKRYRSSIIQVG